MLVSSCSCGAVPASQAGVNLNVKDRSGDTPADDAMIQHHEEALKLILEVRRRGVFSHA